MSRADNLSFCDLDSQMRAMGVPMDQRKRIIAAAKLGVPNPLKQLGLSLPPSGRQRASSRSRSRSNNRTPMPSPPSSSRSAIIPLNATVPAISGATEQLVRAPARAPRVRPRPADEDEQDLDGFLAGGRASTAAIAKARAAERARRDQIAQEQIERERQKREEREAFHAAERDRKRDEEQEQMKKEEEQRQQAEEERKREARREARRREKLRRKEEKRRQKAEEDDDDWSEEEDEPKRVESPEQEMQRRMTSKGFFSQAYKGNEEQRKIWSEPIKGQVSNNYKGFTDAELDRRFGPPGGGAGNGGQKLMTEEEVLAILRKGKSKR